MGGGSGPFTEEAWEAHLATMTPIKRDTTVLGADPGNGTVGTPEGMFPSTALLNSRMARISVATKEPWSMDVALPYYRTHDSGITDSDCGGNKRGFASFARGL